MKSMSIGNKLLAAFGLVGVLLVVLASTGFWGIRSQNSAMDEYKAIADDERAGLVAIGLIHALRREVLAFGTGTDDSAFDRAKTLSDTVIAAIEGKIAGEEHPDHIAKLNALLEKQSDYMAMLNRLPGMATEQRMALINGEMRALARRVVDQLEAGLEEEGAERIEIREAAMALSDFLIWLMASVGVVGALLGLFIGWLSARSIATPIVGMTQTMTSLSEGKYDVTVPGSGRGDEIGAMSKAVAIFKASMMEAENLRVEQERMKQTTEAQRRQMMLDLAAKFEASVKGVVESVGAAASQMQSSATRLSASATQTASQSHAVSAATEEASANVQTVASASEELSASISEIRRQVSQSAGIAQKASKEADSTTAEVRNLAEAAARIGEVVSLISEIASQTNLLALNATIEAARAGEAGKGFAVVASEVKTLAAQTAKATEEISSKVTEIQSATNNAVSAIEHIAGTIGQINQISSAIASAVEEQGAATGEIARNVQQAAIGTQEVSSNIGGVTQAATETGSSAQQLLAAAKDLSTQASHLAKEVDLFLNEVRAA